MIAFNATGIDTSLARGLGNQMRGQLDAMLQDTSGYPPFHHRKRGPWHRAMLKLVKAELRPAIISIEEEGEKIRRITTIMLLVPADMHQQGATGRWALEIMKIVSRSREAYIERGEAIVITRHAIERMVRRTGRRTLADIGVLLRESVDLAASEAMRGRRGLLYIGSRNGVHIWSLEDEQISMLTFLVPGRMRENDLKAAWVAQCADLDDDEVVVLEAAG